MLTYFVSDVHLGLDVANPDDREARFVRFLKDIPIYCTRAIYLLGDIWDFWYEYRDVVPKGFNRVFAMLQDLMAAGVRVYFFPGNHDIWCYHYFEELGMIRLRQPCVVEIDGVKFCLGHGDGLGPGHGGYKLMRGIFHNRLLQAMFSSLHPWIAFRLGKGWSKKSRLAKSRTYEFRGTEEPLYKYCVNFPEKVRYFIFGHYHCHVDIQVSPAGIVGAEDGSARLLLLRDWIDCSNWIVFDGTACKYEESPAH